MRYLISALIALMFVGAVAQDSDLPPVELKTTSRIIYPERMGLSGSTSLLETLQLVSELNFNGFDNMLNNFVVKINDEKCTDNAITILQLMPVSDVESIEIDMSGLQGIEGTLNINTKVLKNGTHGYADLSADTRGGINGMVKVGDHSGPATYFMSISSRHVSAKTTTDERYLNGSSTDLLTDKFTDNHNSTTLQSVDAGAIFKFSQDQLKLRLHRSGYNIDKNGNTLATYQKATSQIQDETIIKKTYYFADARYQHNFRPDNMLELRVNYTNNYQPQMNDVTEVLDGNLSKALYNGYQTSSRLSSLNMTARTISSRIPHFKYEVGIESVLAHTKQNDAIYDNQILKLGNEFKYTSNTFAPYAELAYSVSSHVTIEAGYRVHFLHYACRHKDYDYWSANYINQMWRAGLRYLLDQHSSFGLDYSHRINEPTVAQNYPYPVLNITNPNSYIRGNENFELPTYEVVDLSYSYTKPKFTFTANTRYYHIANGLSMVRDDSFVGPRTMYIWKNGAACNSIAVNLSAYAHFGVFSMTAGFSYTSSRYSNEQKDNNNDYFMFRLMPMVHVGQSMSVTALINFKGPQTSYYFKNDSYWNLALRFNKSFGTRWVTYLQWNDILDSNQVTTTRNQANEFRTVLNPSNNLLLAGVSYSF